jgi:hypothetical protein
LLEWRERRLLVTLAGGFAQRRFAPRSPWRRDMRSDLELAADRIAELGHRGKVADAYQMNLELRTEALVEKHWPYIEAVAATLLEKKTMTKREVRQVINDAQGLHL